MSERIEEYEEPKTHSIVTDACELRPNHKGSPVTFRGVTGILIRYITICEHKLLELTLTEARECLELNADDTAI